MNLDMKSYECCELCPRMCKVARTQNKVGWCGSSDELRISRAALHYWEEPCISGVDGSGAIFFSGCSLKCVFCQNHAISRGIAGNKISVRRLAKIMLELQEQGANNINLVTPMHFAPHVKEAILLAKQNGLTLPIVCNTGGYERSEVVESMSEVVDIWLVDFKYSSPLLAKEMSLAPDYPQYAKSALKTMMDSLDERVVDEDGIMQKGVIVRHLILPGHADDSMHVLEDILEIAPEKADISIMNQYTPNDECIKKGGLLASTVTKKEYDKVLDYAEDLGFEHIWWQEEGTVSNSFIPEFDNSGVLGSEL